MKKNYLIYCKCIADVTKLEDCFTCPHCKGDDKPIDELCAYTPQADSKCHK